MLLEIGLDVLQSVQSRHFGGFLGRRILSRATCSMSCSTTWSGRFGTLSRQARLTLVIYLPLSGGWVARVLGGTLSEGATLFNLAVLTGAAIEGF